MRLGLSSNANDDLKLTVDTGRTEDSNSKPSGEYPGGNPNPDSSGRRSFTQRSEVSHDIINSSTESSRLALSVKRSADTSLEYSDDELCAVHVNRSELEMNSQGSGSEPLQDSQRNVLNLSKLTQSVDFVTPRSDLSSSWTTTSDDVSKKSADTSSEAGLSSVDSCLLHTRRRSRRRSSHGIVPMKENMLPSDEAVGTTPPCVHHVSPPPFDDGMLQSQPSFHKSCRSLSWVSTGPLHALAQRACASSVGAETRCRVPGYGHPSNRWTIAVEVDADVEMFSSYIPDNTVKIPAMNMSTHW